MPYPTYAASLATFIVTVPANTGAFVSVYSLLSAAQKLRLQRFVKVQGNLAGDSPYAKAAQMTMRPLSGGPGIYISDTAWGSAGAGSSDQWALSGGTAEEYPLDDALNNIFVISQSSSTTTMELRVFNQPALA